MDLTYIPMARASSIWPLCSLVQRRVLQYRGGIVTMEAAFLLETLEELALATHATDLQTRIMAASSRLRHSLAC